MAVSSSQVDGDEEDIFLRYFMCDVASQNGSVERFSHLVNSSAMLANLPLKTGNHLSTAMESHYQIY